MVRAEPVDELLLLFGQDVSQDWECFFTNEDPNFERMEFDRLVDTRDVLAGDLCEGKCDSDCDELHWDMVYTEKQQGYLRHYCSMVSCTSQPCPFLFDLDQNPVKRPRFVATQCPNGDFGLMPSLISHGTYHHSMLKRPLLAVEWLGVHGLPIHEKTGRAYNDVVQLLATNAISHSHVKSMVGNGWHLASIGPFIMELLSSIEVRRVVQVPIQLSVSTNHALESPSKKQKIGAMQQLEDRTTSPGASSPSKSEQSSECLIVESSPEKACSLGARSWAKNSGLPNLSPSRLCNAFTFAAGVLVRLSSCDIFSTNAKGLRR